jgi:hypothetical protein
MLMRSFEKSSQRFCGCRKSFGEFSLLLIAPSGFEIAHARVQAADEVLQFIVEAGEVLSESPKLGWIDIGFGHVLILHDSAGRVSRNRPGG